MLYATIMVVSSFAAIISLLFGFSRSIKTTTIIAGAVIVLMFSVVFFSSRLGMVGSPSSLSERRLYRVEAIAHVDRNEIVVLTDQRGNVSCVGFEASVSVTVNSLCKLIRQQDGRYTLLEK